MKKVVRLTESELIKIIKRVIKEDNSQSSNIPKEDVVKCASVGTKSLGYCNRKTKQPLVMFPCSYIGVKSLGMCDGKTGQPIKGDMEKMIKDAVPNKPSPSSDSPIS